jgi:hypothetical protein
MDRFNAFIAPIAYLLAKCFSGVKAPAWWGGLNLPVAQFELLCLPATWRAWILEAVLHAVEQKIAEGLPEISFQQGLAFTPIVMTKPLAKGRPYGSTFFTSIALILPVGLIAFIGKGMLENSLRHPPTEVAGETFWLDGQLGFFQIKDKATSKASLAIDFRGPGIMPMAEHRIKIQRLETLARHHLLSHQSLGVLRLPSHARTPPIRANVFHSYQLPSGLATGGGDWSRRFEEALHLAEQGVQHPVLPPVLLYPTADQLTAFLAQMIFDHQGMKLQAPPAEPLMGWLSEGAQREEFSLAQQNAGKWQKRKLKEKHSLEPPDAPQLGGRFALVGSEAPSSSSWQWGQGWQQENEPWKGWGWVERE